jgi:hypothetical protein
VKPITERKGGIIAMFNKQEREAAFSSRSPTNIKVGDSGVELASPSRKRMKIAADEEKVDVHVGKDGAIETCETNAPLPDKAKKAKTAELLDEDEGETSKAGSQRSEVEDATA